MVRVRNMGPSKSRFLRVRPVIKVAGLIWLVLVLPLTLACLVAAEGVSSETEDWESRLEMLRSVPYLATSEVVVDENQVGVVWHDEERAYPGYNLYNASSSGEAFLLDMEGRVVHRWIYPPLTKDSGTGNAIMLENGDLLVVKEYLELLRLSWNSKPVWRRILAVHHDVTPAHDGSFYAIVRLRRNYRGLKVYFPAIVHLTMDGTELARWSADDHLDEIRSVFNTRHFLDNILDGFGADRWPKRRIPERMKAALRSRERYYDYFHLNTVAVLPANASEEIDSRFRRGNLLICFRNVNQIAVLEKETFRVLWAWGEGELEWPHHPTMLPNGHIIIFDNGVKRRHSRVVELDPVAGVIIWEYVANPVEDFFTETRGSAQRLPNGNTLICESEDGRVFEVTGEGEVVWEWLNPDSEEREGWKRVGLIDNQRPTVKYRRTAYRMLRLPCAQVERLLNRWWWWE